MIVIGLSAKLGCGKTTLADNILARLDTMGKQAVRMAFGDPLKRECSSYFGFPLEWCYSQEGKMRLVAREALDNFTVREALQWYGTDFRRAQDPLYWIKAMRKELVLLAEAGVQVVVVDDVRFPDEAQVCLDNGYCFRVEPFEGWKPGPHAEHASETALDGYDKFTEVYHPGFGLGELRLVAEKIEWRVFGHGKELMG